MSKAKKYAVEGAIAVGLVKTIINAVKQLNQMETNPQQKFNWKELLLEAGKGAAIGGIGGGFIGAIEDHQNSLEKPLNTDSFLYAVASKLKLNKEDATYLKLQQKADQLIGLLKNKYAEKLASEPFRIGSTERGTALRNKFDIDIALAFKKNSFRSTADMFDNVAAFLEGKIGDYSIVRVRDQHVSVGVYFKVNQREYKVDVVPKKRSSINGKNKSGYLYVNDYNFWKDNSSYTKTDFHALNSIRLSEVQKRIVIILKHWKSKNNLPLSSHLLENPVLDAYKMNRYRIPGNLTGKIIMVLKHIAENLDVAVIKSIENTNNVLTDISVESKAAIIDACIKVVLDYEYQPNSLFDTFGK
ncbi:hypothetical protein [Agriterribacter sp.]|uniref:hypothetical protein n=1 Tax=Agriterribacter sp. TaxID=2821509 RepID=UPI002C0C3089|nr:hypothetical protein [Agriterribacter sp.]HTN07610.1 hypothetical protein [Agriterribacter sp.]